MSRDRHLKITVTRDILFFYSGFTGIFIVNLGRSLIG